MKWRFVVGCVVLAGLWTLGCGSSASDPRPKTVPPPVGMLMSISTPEDEELLKKLCRQCHAFSDPDMLPRLDWDHAIKKMVAMSGYGKVISPKRIDQQAVVNWFRERAPESLPLTDRTGQPEQVPPLRRILLTSPRPAEAPFVSQVKLLTSPSGERRLLTSDMRHGWICEATALSESPRLRVLTELVPHACRLEPIDLSGSGEMLVSNLGSFPAMDHNLGSVDWLRPRADGWERQTLAGNLGRVADLKPFDFDGDGDLDLAVAEFGWRTTGHVLLFENKTRKSAEPQFVQRTLDDRHGAVQVEISDVDGNGRPDVIVLLAQEHEALVAYLNQPDGSFVPRELFRAPHPVWGYSGFQCLDFDGDQDLDVLLTNGDMMDGPTIKPFHGVSWLENLGDWKFQSHTLAELPGAHRAEAADLDGDGDLDVVACTFLPEGVLASAAGSKSPLPPALVWLEQMTPGHFEFHVWKHGPGRYPTLTTGDFDGDGKTDVGLGLALWEKPKAGESDVGYLELWLSRPAP